MHQRSEFQMQPIGRRMTRDQIQVLKQLRTEDGFEDMNTHAFLSLLRLLNAKGLRQIAGGASNGFDYAIQRVRQ